jgi:hypothetical protein
LDQNPFNGEGRPLLWLRRADFWGVVQQYFPAALRQERPLDPKQAYVLVMYPHGIIGMSAWLHFVSVFKSL